jgi:hypothetical protein
MTDRLKLWLKSVGGFSLAVRWTQWMQITFPALLSLGCENIWSHCTVEMLKLQWMTITCPIIWGRILLCNICSNYILFTVLFFKFCCACWLKPSQFSCLSSCVVSCHHRSIAQWHICCDIFHLFWPIEVHMECRSYIIIFHARRKWE